MITGWWLALGVVLGTFSAATGLIIAIESRRMLERFYGVWLFVIGLLAAGSAALDFWAR